MKVSKQDMNINNWEEIFSTQWGNVDAEVKGKKNIWANALLSDGNLLFYYVGDCDCSVYSFYKDFYYAGIDMVRYSKEHKLEVAKMQFTIFDEKYNNYVFDVLATDFFKLFPISPDSKGSKPY